MKNALNWINFTNHYVTRKSCRQTNILWQQHFHWLYATFNCSLLCLEVDKKHARELPFLQADITMIFDISCRKMILLKFLLQYHIFCNKTFLFLIKLRIHAETIFHSNKYFISETFQCEVMIYHYAELKTSTKYFCWAFNDAICKIEEAFLISHAIFYS